MKEFLAFEKANLCSGHLRVGGLDVFGSGNRFGIREAILALDVREGVLGVQEGDLVGGLGVREFAPSPWCVREAILLEP